MGENIVDGLYWAEANDAVPTTKPINTAIALLFLTGNCPLTRRPFMDVVRVNSDNAATEYDTNLVFQ